MECLCTVLGPLERAQRWASRAQPIIRRLIEHRHRVDSQKVQFVMSLVMGFEYGDARSLDPAYAHHSHHLKNCPAAARNRPWMGRSPLRPPVMGGDVQNPFLGRPISAWDDLMATWRAVDEPPVRPAAGPSPAGT